MLAVMSKHCKQQLHQMKLMFVCSNSKGFKKTAYFYLLYNNSYGSICLCFKYYVCRLVVLSIKSDSPKRIILNIICTVCLIRFLACRRKRTTFTQKLHSPNALFPPQTRLFDCERTTCEVHNLCVNSRRI